MDMKKLLSIVSTESETKQLNESIVECGDMPQAVTPPASPPVTMNLSMNANGVDQIKELLGLMSGAQASRVSEPMAMPAPGMSIGTPAPKEPDMIDLIKLTSEPKEEGAYDASTSPDEQYGDLDSAVPSGDDLHREKKQFSKAQDGDNAMAVESIRAQLDARYKEIKEGKKPDFLDVDKDGDKEEPMKKALKDKEETVEEAKDDEDRVPAKKTERETTLPSGAKVKTTSVQGWQSQKADKAANKERKDSYKD